MPQAHKHNLNKNLYKACSPIASCWCCLFATDPIQKAFALGGDVDFQMKLAEKQGSGLKVSKKS